jgi:hypothetical protein
MIRGGALKLFYTLVNNMDQKTFFAPLGLGQHTFGSWIFDQCSGLDIFST